MKTIKLEDLRAINDDMEWIWRRSHEVYNDPFEVSKSLKDLAYALLKVTQALLEEATNEDEKEMEA